MSDTFVLQAQTRDVLGKKVKNIRKDGLTPAVLYGLDKEPVSLTIETVPFVKLYEQAGTSTLIDVVIDGGESEKVLVGEIQTHPVTDRLRHVDFKRVDMKATITASVSLSFVGESLAVKNLGGSLTTQIDSIDMECLPSDLVSEIEVDLAALATFDDSIYVRDVKVSDKVTVLTDGDQLIATVNPPRTEEDLSKLDEDVVEDVTQVEGVAKEGDAPAEGEEKEKPAE